MFRLSILMTGAGGGGFVALTLAKTWLQQTPPSPTDWLAGTGAIGLAGFVVSLVLNWKRSDDKQHLLDAKEEAARWEASSERVLEAFISATKVQQEFLSFLKSRGSVEELASRVEALEAGQMADRRSGGRYPRSGS